MSRVCIVFDRIRLEEKMLQDASNTLGHDTIMLDAKIT
ncbi:MAG: lysine biosynthesis enzyme LysX, partial [Thaumarchaeota archaeon]|nr:lysine biosynthesis enzyme LysX [Nitrososphaerota archaeon]